MGLKYQPGDVVAVHSNHYGEKRGYIEKSFYKGGIPFYLVNIQGIGRAEVREGRITEKIGDTHMHQSFAERVDAEMSKKLSMVEDERADAVQEPKKEVQSNPERAPQVPGGAPGPKKPEDLDKNPKDAINQNVVNEMGAKHNLAFDPHKGKEWWESVTGGKTHKITACMDAAKDFADNPGAFCKSLADEVGYDPNA